MYFRCLCILCIYVFVWLQLLFNSSYFIYFRCSAVQPPWCFLFCSRLNHFISDCTLIFHLLCWMVAALKLRHAWIEWNNQNPVLHGGSITSNTKYVLCMILHPFSCNSAVHIGIFGNLWISNTILNKVVQVWTKDGCRAMKNSPMGATESRSLTYLHLSACYNYTESLFSLLQLYGALCTWCKNSAIQIHYSVITIIICHLVQSLLVILSDKASCCVR